jgi:hypothetical protein
MRIASRLIIVLALVGAGASQGSLAASCDKACLEDIAAKYRTAWRMHDVSLAPFATKLRFTENNVEMALPDGSWDTISMEVGRLDRPWFFRIRKRDKWASIRPSCRARFRHLRQCG